MKNFYKRILNCVRSLYVIFNQNIITQKMKDVIIILQIQNQKLLKSFQEKHIFNFFRFLKIRYNIKINLVVLIFNENVNEIRNIFQKNEIINLEVINMNISLLFNYSEFLLYRIKKHHNFEYLFFLKYENNFD